MNKTRVIVAACVIAGGALALGGCRTAMRGSGYKRLITSYAESVRLDDLTARRVEEARSSGDERLDEISALHDEVAALRGRWHDSLDLRRRETWNRSTMNACWKKYLRLYPEDRALYDQHRSERRVEVDEIRSRRTPLTHDQRFRHAPPPRDPPPHDRASGQRTGSWMSEPPPTPERPEAGPAPTGVAEPAIRVEDALPDPTEEMLMDLLEEQGRRPSGG